MIKPKVLVLVLHSEAEPWRTIGEVQLATWMASCATAGVEALHYVGNAPEMLLDGSTLRLDAPDNVLSHTGPKTQRALQWALENREFDFVFRTNTSSYVDPRLLVEFLSKRPRTRHYGGSHNPTAGGFAVGCGMSLSRDVCSLLAKSPCRLAHGVDDVAIARCLRRSGIVHEHQPRTDLLCEADMVAWRAAGQPLSHHYRCKPLDESLRPGWERSVMLELHAARQQP